MSIVKPQEFEKSLLHACAQEIIAAFQDKDPVINAIYSLCIDGELEIFLSPHVESYAVYLAQCMALEVAKCIELFVEAGENYNRKIHRSVSGFLLTESELREELEQQPDKPIALDRTKIYLRRVEDYTESIMRTFEADEKARITKLPIEIYEEAAQIEAYPLFDHPQTIGLAYARQFIVSKISFLYARAGISPSEEVGRTVDEEREDFLQLLFHHACGGDLEEPNHPIASMANVSAKGLIH